MDGTDGVDGENGTDGVDAEPIDEEKIIQVILSKIPVAKPVDEKSLIKKVISAIPKNKASLKIIQENFETDPMSIIEKIMALPEEQKNKLNLGTKNISGLDQTIRAMQAQLGRGYLHGGGDTVVAGTNVTITTNANGNKIINVPSAPVTWIYYATTWSVSPTLNSSIAGGDVYNYTLSETTRYRFVPTTYDPTLDAFYTTFSGGVLSGIIIARG